MEQKDVASVLFQDLSPSAEYRLEADYTIKITDRNGVSEKGVFSFKTKPSEYQVFYNKIF